MAKKKKTTKDAVKVLHKRYIRGNKKRLESLQRERENLDIAEQIYNLRTQVGLSQKQLADLVGTTQSVISRLEDADYNGHSLAMLRKIGAALHQRVQVQFVPEDADYVRA
jgi:ribosome-binding protein aMBF1 (putative translation factor)